MDEIEVWKFVAGAFIGIALSALLFLFIVFSGAV